jgi:hypothetical protein
MKPPRAPTLVGMAVGLVAALLVLGYASMQRTQVLPAMLSDEGGRIQAVVMQYATGSQFVAPVFQQYLGYQSADVKVYFACPGPEDFAEIRKLVGPVACQILPVYTGHVITAWSRDRWVALHSPVSNLVTLLSPKGENGQEDWPARAGDSKVGEDLANAFPAVFAAQRSGLFFDGGDFLADGSIVFVTRAVLDRNLQHTVTTRDSLLQALAHDLRLRPVLLDSGPQHHAGMFMMSAGADPQAPPNGSSRRVMVVADPSLGQRYYPRSPEADAAFTDGPDFSLETQKKYDAVAEVCGQNGYRVVRIPVVPARAGKMYLTYVNVILDRTGAGKPVVYMPTYARQEKLNRAATEVWQTLGYEVRPIDCTAVWQAGGTLHCLVNVFQRER